MGICSFEWDFPWPHPIFLANAFGIAFERHSSISNKCLLFFAFWCFALIVFPLSAPLFYYAVFPLSSIVVAIKSLWKGEEGRDWESGKCAGSASEWRMRVGVLKMKNKS